MTRYDAGYYGSTLPGWGCYATLRYVTLRYVIQHRHGMIQRRFFRRNTHDNTVQISRHDSRPSMAVVSPLEQSLQWEARTAP